MCYFNQCVFNIRFLLYISSMFPKGLGFLLLMFIIGQSASIPTRSSSTSSCGYNSCNPVKDDMLNVHIVPHTHDDVGWVKTYSEYYREDVKTIITSVVDNLKRDRQRGGDKRFIYVEMAFLKLWWQEQDEEVKHTVRNLINEGRLEIILGGWCMNDEATPYYIDIIDQHTVGFEFIRHNFGECGRPKIGWQIDPFGHSREVASLFAQFGFDGMFVGRIDYQDKRQREKTKSMEMVWQASESIGRSADIFVGVLDNVYWPPKGFCWDYWCSDQELVNSSDQNKKAKVDEFIRIIEEEANHYATNHVMVEMGSDFQYRWADKWYENLDELIKCVIERQDEDGGRGINLLYSTPSCYLYQLNRLNKTWDGKKDDFFPYAHRDHSFWTGYFTSRPHLKRLVRTAGTVLQTCKQLNALAQLENTEDDINYLKEAMAVLQHHDGVSGTEKQYVADDYTRLLNNGLFYCKDVIYSAIKKLLTVSDTSSNITLESCDNLPLHVCNISELNDKFSVVVYNPLARPRCDFIHLPVVDAEYEVFNHEGDEIEHQMLPITAETMSILERPSSRAEMDLVFTAEIPALGLSTFFIQKKKEDTVDKYNDDWLEETIIETAEQSFGPEAYTDAVEMIENQYYTVSVDRNTGLISRLWNKHEDVAISLKQNFFYYIGHAGYNYDGRSQASGAYIFRPSSNIPKRANQGRPVSIVSYKGSLVQEIRQVYCPWLSQVIRLYNNQSHVELEWTVGPLPSGDGREGREVITKYSTDMDNDAILYTDLNGRESMKRKKDERDTWQFDQSESVAGNYYPITSRAYIKDERRELQLTVLVDRSEGAASIHNGELEIMIHRRTFYDDSLGVQEPLTEYGANGNGIVVRGKHYVMLTKTSTAAATHRPLYQKIYLQPFITLSTQHPQYTDWSKILRQTWSGIKKDLPDNVQLLSLDLWRKPVVETEHTALLLRLEHVYERFEDDMLSGPSIVYLQDLFQTFNIVEVIELGLGANMRLEDMDRLAWNINHDARTIPKYTSKDMTEDFTIELSPMQIRTFQINVQ